MTSGTDPETGGEAGVKHALERYMAQAALPFAVTRGESHALAYANSAFCGLAGIADNLALGTPVASFLSPADRPSFLAVLDRAFAGQMNICDERVSLGTGAAWRCNVWPVIAAGRCEALGVEIRPDPPADSQLEIQRELAERMLLGALRERGFADDAEAARRRAAFLAEAGRLLAESMDRASTLIALAKIAMPSLNAWSILEILEEGGVINRLGIYHPDPEKQKLAVSLESTWLPEPDDPFGLPAMKRDAQTITITENIEATLAATAHSAENLHLLRQLGIGSLITVPLIARKRLLGAITFVGAGVRHTDEDVKLAEALAARAALALDNAQVYDLALVLKQGADMANRAKSAFLGSMSHELRTPLNAIGGYIDLMDAGLRGPVTEEQHADFDRVRRNQRHLSALITEILNFEKVGSGGVSYHLADVDGCAALATAVELIEPLFAQKGLEFTGVPCVSGVIARADPEKLTQILVNLLSNAIKFTPEGGRISTECATSSEKVLLTVRDTGIGVEPAKLAAIFEPFVQVRDTLADRGTGVGLGLAISRDLVRAMGGELTAESIPGEGSSFTVALPKGGGA